MRSLRCIVSIVLVQWLSAAAVLAADPPVPSFSSATVGGALPRGWEPILLRGIAPSRYSLVRDENGVVLRAEAAASASGLALTLTPPIRERRILRWRWKGEQALQVSDHTQRATDDAIARVYVTFTHPPEQLTLVQRALDALIRALYGRSPPHATLMYLWDGRAMVGTSRRNAYTDRVHNIVVESGSAHLGQWLAYERDIDADYRAAFGSAPSQMTGIAVMTDADNTAGSAAALYGDITLRPR